MKQHANIILALLIALLTLGACSTTSRLGEGEVLYTGVKKVAYHRDSVKIDPEVQSEIFTIINVKPNNPLYSPYYRTPLPIGLWVYNHWNPEATGLKGWLYKKLVSEPKLISHVRPKTRVEMINTLLRNNGYFDSDARYTLNYNSHNKKKASITYEVNVHKPYELGQVKYPEVNTPVGHLIDSCARSNHYYKPGSRYCLDSLNEVRISITNALRNKGYYFFRPEYLKYHADSVTTKGIVNMQLLLSSDIPNSAQVQYLVNKVTVTVMPPSRRLKGIPDTIETPRCTLVKYKSAHIRDKSLLSCIRARKGRPFRVSSMDRMQVRLSNLGIFRNVEMQANPLDSTNERGDGLLDLDVYCRLDRPMEASVQLQGAYKSNSFLGPGLKFGVAHKNLFGGGERLNVDINAAYEWQTGKSGAYKNRDFNSYELGYNVELAIPRLIAPSFVDRSRRFTNWTRVSHYASILNRPSFFKMVKTGVAFTWEWHSNKHTLHQFTPFKLVFSKLLSTTSAMDSVMAYNPVINNSFKDTYIPSVNYVFTYDNTFGRHGITWTSSLMEAGNVFSGIWSLVGKKGNKKFFNASFSQFVKAQTQLVWNNHLSRNSSLVSRLFIGVAYAYGNSDEVPYSEQFYAGGANSVRAFAIRSLGPGAFASQKDNTYGYFDQTGTFKFEANCEYRFPILGYLRGAVFLDAGNVWLVKDDGWRNEGVLGRHSFFDQLATGTGLGLRFDMEMLVVRADLGIGIHAPYPTGKSGYYNIPKFKDGLALHLAIGYPF